MIYIKVRNGLGNQMFVYAFGDFLKSKFPSNNVKFDYSELPYLIGTRITYDVNSIFKAKFDMASSSEIRKYCGKPFFLRRINNKRSICNRIARKINNFVFFRSEIEVIREPNPWSIPQSFLEKIYNLSLLDNIYYFFYVISSTNMDRNSFFCIKYFF